MANEFKIKNGLIVSGSAEIEQDLIVRGTLTADEYHISVTSSSILYESGSTVFGNSLDDIHKFTGSVQITGSISLNGQAIGTGKLDETTFNSYTSSISSSIGGLSSSIATTTSGLTSTITSLSSSLTSSIGSLSSSIASINDTQNGRLDSLETASGSIRTNFNTFTSSYTTGSFTGSFKGDGTNLFNIPASGVTGLNLTQIADGSVTASVSNTNGLRVNSKSEITGSLIVTNGITGSINFNNLTNVPTLVSGSSQIDITGTTGYSTFSSSISTSIGSLSSSVATTTNDLSSSIATTTLGTKNRVDSIEISTGSLNTFTGSINTTIKSKLDSESVISGSVQILITGTTGYSTFSSSVSTSIGELSSSVATKTSGLSSSIGSLSSSIATTTLNTKNRVDSIETTTGSLNTFTSSASGRLTSLETASGSIRTDFNTYTGSNNTTNTTQDGRLTSIEGITGSISSLNTYTGSNNTVIGTLQTSTSSLNSYTSSNTTNIDAIHISTGSFKSFTSSFDTAFGMSGADVTVKGNLTVSGTQTTVNSTTVAIGDNIIQLNGTGATNAGLVVRDATAPNTASGSFLWDSTNDKWIAGALGSEDDVVLKTATQTLTNKTINASQLVDASVTNAKLQYSSLTIAGTSVSLNGSISAATILSGTGTVSGSSQISYTGLSNIPTGIVSGSSQITYGSISGTPSGIVSGSVQVDLTATTNYSTGIKTRLNSEGVLSGSAQVVAALPSGTVSGSSQILAGTTIHSGAFFNGISVVSGSAQISFGSITGVPSGLVSGSSQISFGSISSIPSGLVSGSSQVTGIGNAQLTNSSFNIGTTSISLGRASASQTLTGVSIDGNAATVASLTPFQFFNNMGNNHSTHTDFNSISNFGFRYVQGSTNGPGTGSSQFYGFSIGLGNDYAYSDYALQLAIPRYPSSDKYITFRTREATTWGSWNKISAGYADSAGSVSGANVSGNISGNASNITSYTINQSVGTSNSVQFANLGVGVSPGVTLHARGSGEMVRFENTSTGNNEYTQLNFKAGSRNGYIWLGNQNTSSWAGAGGLNIYTENGNMDFWTTAVQRIRIQNDGHMVPFVSATYNLGSSSLRWGTVFTSDLSLSNGIGDYTIVEGEEKLYLYNNKNNKVYSFVLQEEDPETATPKKS